MCSPSFSNLKESGLFQSFVYQEAKCLFLNIQSYLPACIQSLLSINIILLTSGLLRTKKPWKNKGLKSGALFPFNPKFQKFWLVHCTSKLMEWTISVWSERNIRDQLWRWSSLTGPVISVWWTKMSRSIWQNCCLHYRSFVSCLQEQ